MNSLILGGIDYLVNQLVHWTLWGVGIVADGISHLAILEVQLPWVQHVKTDIEAVAWALLGLYIAYKAFHAYIMYNEGTADPDGSVLTKSILRTVIYVGISSALSLAVFQWGISFAATILSTPILSAAQSFHGIVGNIVALPGAAVGLGLALILGVGVGVILLLVVCFQIAIRGAELTIYYLAAPIVALGQMNPDGGTWSGWWANLVILSLSQAVQMTCFMGLVGTTQLLTSPADTAWIAHLIRHMPIAAPVAMQADALMTAVNVVMALLLMIGWLVVAIRGPHLLKQWSYHSGVGGAAMYVGTTMGRNAFQSAGAKIGGVIGIGK